MNGLMIAGTGVRRDSQGRYSLNDLHSASGGEASKRPGYWLANQQTVELIAELETAGIPAVSSKEGRGGGTYVADPLVVAYAAWISPKFHIEVLNTFLSAKKDAVRQASRHGIAAPVAQEYRALLTIAKLSGLKGNQATLAASQGTERLTGTNPLVLIGQTHLIAQDQVRHYTPTELGKELGESGQAFNKRLESAGYQAKNIHGDWQAVGDGERHAVLMDTGKKHSNGTPIQQLRWLHTVLDAVKSREVA